MIINQNISSPKVDEDADVLFIDYDGTPLYGYSAADFANLTALPSNPSHLGLVGQGWNWTLADAKSYVSSYGSLVIGQMYTTASGKSEIDVDLAPETLAPYLTLAVNGTVTIDWGDGSSQNVSGTSLTTPLSTGHVYASAGKYTISISGQTNTYSFVTSSGATSVLLSAGSTTSNYNRIYDYRVNAVRVAEGVVSIGDINGLMGADYISLPSSLTTLGANAFSAVVHIKGMVLPSNSSSGGYNSIFNECYNLEYISLPKSFMTMSSNCFSKCNSLRRIHLPTSMTTISSSMFADASSLKRVTVPEGVTLIDYQAFNNCLNLEECNLPTTIDKLVQNSFANCRNLPSLVIPANVTNIGATAYSTCSKISSITVLPTTPPTASTNIFGSTFNVETAKIYVPSASLNAYKTASGWSKYASAMVGV